MDLWPIFDVTVLTTEVARSCDPKADCFRFTDTKRLRIVLESQSLWGSSPTQNIQVRGLGICYQTILEEPNWHAGFLIYSPTRSMRKLHGIDESGFVNTALCFS
jgi:hypothetical protein